MGFALYALCSIVCALMVCAMLYTCTQTSLITLNLATLQSELEVESRKSKVASWKSQVGSRKLEVASSVGIQTNTPKSLIALFFLTVYLFLYGLFGVAGST